MVKERGKIRGFYFEIDGADETLQEGLKNFGAALGRALSGPPRPMKALPAPHGKGKSDKDADPDVEDEQPEPDLFDEVERNGDGQEKKGNWASPRLVGAPQ